ncbi:MAG: SLC13 family permease [Candidatus Hydrogenedentes bacterium]|nr:SLC13 family permease [Candidatus Hydrogenedentota bacterium]
MSVEAWFTLSVVTAIFAALVRNWAATDVLFLGATALFALLGIISPEEAFAGFSNSGMLTVAMLFAVAAGLRETGVLDTLGEHFLGRARTEKQVFGRLAAIIVPFSAFLNNTPIVAMFMPIVLDWCRRNNVSASRLLIPLSYMTILGGTCTLIGTSTNLVVHGLMIENGLPGLGMFEIARLGIPYAIVGLAYMYLLGTRLLPERKEMLEQLVESSREYLVEMQIQAGCRLAGQTVEQAGLRHLAGLFLIEIDRDGECIGPVGPEAVLEEGDRLVFTGIVSTILDLEKIPGLVPVADPSYEIAPQEQRKRRLCEAVISSNSHLIGKTIRNADFRTAYGAAVVAVHRGGKRVVQKIGDITLQPGDTLLLQTRDNFLQKHRNDQSFYLINDVAEWSPLRRDRAWVGTVLFLGLIILMTTGWVNTLVAATLTTVLMIFSGCITANEVRKSIEWQVLITIGAAFGVGIAIENSGAATAVAQALVDATAGWGPIAALAVIYLLCSLVTELITNNAAAVLLFPFCLKTAELYDVSSRPFLIALLFAASASFMTPIGYQTNMMVYGPGGYRFTDFARIGAPLHIVLWLIAIVLIPWFWPF